LNVNDINDTDKSTIKLTDYSYADLTHMVGSLSQLLKIAILL